MTDASLMPFGIHKGKRLIDVPAKYLIWLYDENKCSGALKDYIEDNMDALKKETK
ncbi:Putative quorum-sensing-regulated virulence factor [Parapedobacter indicus]|uniref:Putative quorum-sensing-regulated virulence factor n=2 Tax=Parapedobacter indicus TaxID=1477437 RepID=A0A1I3E478_9SPHI|nr:putative quorum-sensing-regulated virulence factor [Parapedobacter indicus]SFH93790.1 Putative quorum-sensing-regulated virulence factor [Parapedobacter indicus]